MNQKTIVKIDFVDLPRNTEKRDSVLYRWLAKRYDVRICDDPDYLLYSAFGDSHLQYDDKIKIFWTGEAIVPDFNLCDYAVGFDRIEFADRYLRWLSWGADTMSRLCRRERSPSMAKALLAGKSKFCNYLYSSTRAHPRRSEIFNVLSGYKRLDSAGRHLNNMDRGMLADRKAKGWFEDSIQHRKAYKFSIASENALHDGYTTEKLLASFLADTIPIYWGNPSVGRDFNTAAMVNCHDYENLDAVLARVRKLDEDDEKWCEVMSQPVFPDATPMHWCDETALDAFLSRIFEQPLESARRRGRGPWNTRYVQQQRSAAQLRRSKTYRTIQRLRRVLGKAVD
ncbi:MAG: glycosyltransferase family 10 [Arenicellales bacterium]|jgi:hypothetical protein